MSGRGGVQGIISKTPATTWLTKGRPNGAQRSHHYFHLLQRRVIFAVAKLKQAASPARMIPPTRSWYPSTLVILPDSPLAL